MKSSPTDFLAEFCLHSPPNLWRDANDSEDHDEHDGSTLTEKIASWGGNPNQTAS